MFVQNIWLIEIKDIIVLTGDIFEMKEVLMKKINNQHFWEKWVSNHRRCKKESMERHTKNIHKIKNNISSYIKIVISRGGA